MKKLSMRKALASFERDHGDCDSNTCNMSVAYNYGYLKHALDLWVSSGASDRQIFTNVELPFSFEDSNKEAIEMTNSIEHIECECGAVVWNPETCSNYCDNCGKTIGVKNDESSQ